MPYVHGHARRLGWVVGHHRRPHRDEAHQLALDETAQEADRVQAVEIPAPRRSPEGGPHPRPRPAAPAPRRRARQEAAPTTPG